MDISVEKKSEASPTITLEESKEDIEYQRQREQDEHPAQPLLELWISFPFLARYCRMADVG